MRPPSTVLFCAIDELIPVTGKPLTGFLEFREGLSDAGIPCVWISNRSRQQLDPLLRRLGHTGPFIAEGGAGVYLPEDYFHLKPAKTIRLGRFTCIPIASPQPAAQEALGLLSEATGVAVVPLRSLSPRELMQNTGLSRQDAEALHHRDFDELFFFAGASQTDIQRFQRHAMDRGLALRQLRQLWSLAENACVVTCIRELRKLYDRALHAHVASIGLGLTAEAPELIQACDRALILTERNAKKPDAATPNQRAPKLLPLFSAQTWPEALRSVLNRKF